MVILTSWFTAGAGSSGNSCLWLASVDGVCLPWWGPSSDTWLLCELPASLPLARHCPWLLSFHPGWGSSQAGMGNAVISWLQAHTKWHPVRPDIILGCRVRIVQGHLESLKRKEYKENCIYQRAFPNNNSCLPFVHIEQNSPTKGPGVCEAGFPRSEAAFNCSDGPKQGRDLPPPHFHAFPLLHDQHPPRFSRYSLGIISGRIVPNYFVALATKYPPP